MDRQTKLDLAYMRGYRIGRRDRNHNRKQRGLWLAVQAGPSQTAAFYQGYRAAFDEAVQLTLV